ncbi:Protein of unknown function [Lentzea waywayandensis]|uniref:DUF692 domain-containing protein n=1 Tax=Lentzea waywayandensis TaxID=84724 RepID=A0A1I6FJP7_9PSEU|nr:DUF692 family multinuclear iron-containing protein [Lentzea waywayandensis]SFR30161.1 Protein of unknown function [Lentzea waywayandensis]
MIPTLTLEIASPGAIPVALRALNLAGMKPNLVEVFWDGFCHLEPIEVMGHLEEFDAAISLHISNSRFLETPEDELSGYLSRLRKSISVLAPTAVSDHVYRFTVGQLRPCFPLECDYRAVERSAVDRIIRYQDTIGQTLLLENYASTSAIGGAQPEFFEEIMSKTGCRLLWDVTNALVAHFNGWCEIDRWTHLLEKSRSLHVHVGTLGVDKYEGDYRVTQGDGPDSASMELLKDTVRLFPVSHIVYEGSAGASAEDLAQSLLAIESAALRSPFGSAGSNPYSGGGPRNRGRSGDEPQDDSRQIERALRDLYLTSTIPNDLPEGHSLWQAPLYGTPADASTAEIESRMMRAGELWLENHDLSHGRLLVLSRSDAELSFGFERAASPSESAKARGPIRRRLLSPLRSHGVGGYLFAETDHRL